MNYGSKKTWGKICLGVAVGLLLTCVLGIAGEAPKVSKDRVVVDLIQQKNGCADCHQGSIKTPDGKEKDITLAGEVKNISRHPRLDAKATIQACVKCHGAGEQRTRFINSLHGIHLNSPIYVREFKQTCSGCHDMRHIKGM